MDATTKDIFDSLKSYRCRYSVNEMGDSMELVDMLTPSGDKDIGRGQTEMEILAEHISEELFYKNRG